jgi:HTH-type transcriptional regulator / antitoxin HigA
MNWKIIRTRKEYERAIRRLETIYKDTGASRRDEFELLSLLVEHYENEKLLHALPDPVEAIKFRMEQLGLRQKDLARAIGLKSRVSEILNKKRKLTLEMVRKLHVVLGIPTEILIREY